MTTTLTTAEALRHAADLLEQIGWNEPITWSGTDTVCLHMVGDGEYHSIPASPDPTDGIVDQGATLLTHRTLGVGGYERDITEWQMPTGLKVRLCGVRRPIEQVAAMHRHDDESPPRDRSEAYLRWWDEHENELMEAAAIEAMEAKR